jgi:hypothetical protein
MKVMLELDCDGCGNLFENHDHAYFSDGRHAHVPCMEKETLLTTETHVKGDVLQ